MRFTFLTCSSNVNGNGTTAHAGCYAEDSTASAAAPTLVTKPKAGFNTVLFKYEPTWFYSVKQFKSKRVLLMFLLKGGD